MKKCLSLASSATAIGSRTYQEDRFFVDNLSSGLLLAVFDGHGGDGCAIQASISFADLFGSASMAYKSPEDALRETFKALNEMTHDMQSGAAASIAFIPWEANYVYTAVLGDAPIIVKKSDSSIWRSPEHNVRTNGPERLAAISRGGVVSNGYLSPKFSYLGLQMSRALGDKFLDGILDRTPEIAKIPLGKESWVLVATDGVLDPAHENENAASGIISFIENGADAQALVKHATDIARTRDNATAILVRVEQVDL
jgi:serine/threonine protein phosphatase PrpC